MDFIRTCFALFCWIACLKDCKGTLCARVEVPAFSSGNFSIEEGTTKTVHFEVVNNCKNVDDVTVVIEQSNGYGPVAELCKVSTVITNPSCNCENSGRRQTCQFTDEFSRMTQMWRFRSPRDQNLISERTDIIDVTYPTTINTFYFNYTPVEPNVVGQGAFFQAVCQFEDGNPQKRVLLKKDQKVVVAAELAKYRPHSLRAGGQTKCDDTSQYTCEVEGTKERKTATLLVKCPLEFIPRDEPESFTAFLGMDTTLHFEVKSYTKAIQSCFLTRLKNAQERAEKRMNCNSSDSEVAMDGSPPYLRMVVVLKHLSEDDEGSWRIEAQNGVTGHASRLSFNLRLLHPETTERVQESTTRLAVTSYTRDEQSTHDETTPDILGTVTHGHDSLRDVTVIVVPLVVLVLIALLVNVAVIVFLKKRRTDVTPSIPESLEIQPRYHSGQCSLQNSSEENFYMEILDGSSTSTEENCPSFLKDPLFNVGRPPAPLPGYSTDNEPASSDTYYTLPSVPHTLRNIQSNPRSQHVSRLTSSSTQSKCESPAEHADDAFVPSTGSPREGHARSSTQVVALDDDMHGRLTGTAYQDEDGFPAQIRLTGEDEDGYLAPVTSRDKRTDWYLTPVASPEESY